METSVYVHSAQTLRQFGYTCPGGPGIKMARKERTMKMRSVSCHSRLLCKLQHPTKTHVLPFSPQCLDPVELSRNQMGVSACRNPHETMTSVSCHICCRRGEIVGIIIMRIGVGGGGELYRLTRAEVFLWVISGNKGLYCFIPVNRVIVLCFQT